MSLLTLFGDRWNSHKNDNDSECCFDLISYKSNLVCSLKYHIMGESSPDDLNMIETFVFKY